MKVLFVLLSLMTVLSARAQVDTVFLSVEKLADTLYNGLATKAPTGYLANKLSIIRTDSLLLKTSQYSQPNTSKKVDADKMYQWLYESNAIAVGTNNIPSRDSISKSSYSYVGEMDFERDMIVIPIGILNLRFNMVDETSGLSSGVLSKDISIWKDNDTLDNSIVEEGESIIAGPMFDYLTTNQMGMVVKKDYVIGNLIEPDSVSSIALMRNGVWKDVEFDQIVTFIPFPDSVQDFYIRFLVGGDTMLFPFKVNTPDLYDSIKNSNLEKDWYWDWGVQDDDAQEYFCGGNWSPGCSQCDQRTDENGCKIKWCYLPGCRRTGDQNPEKPYIVVTGYRPPMFGQSFHKTWEIYNDNHDYLLTGLRENDYDIIIVKFNMAAKPFKHGLQEAAALFEEFLLYLNGEWKTGDYFENVIQANSMGEDIVRLALLTMEKKHFSNSYYPHHHSRLNVAYDANLYGANIPLGYQNQIVSAMRRPHYGFEIVNWFLAGFLYNTIEQKAFKELVSYHALANDENAFFSNDYQFDQMPNYHWRRQSFLDALQAVSNDKYFIPMPAATRNIAVSLGKISGTNDDPNEYNPGNFHHPGDAWQDWSILGAQFKITASKYTQPGEYHLLFRRKIPAIYFNPFSSSIKHQIGVTGMDEIDMASGSFMNHMGNLIAVCDWTYFPLSQIWNGKNFYTHKAVVSALAINHDLWPSDHSMTLNMQQLGLMYQDFDIVNIPQSDKWGYPNLGHPTDHFLITPFEAIYVDRQIDPHIDLVGSDGALLQALDNFLYGEAEPWYLALQNQEVGAQARPDYEYYVRRRARNVITVGHLVTPSTDPGDYNARPNAKIDLRAGDAIILKPGTHFQNGSDDHLKIEFDYCTSKELNEPQQKLQNSRNNQMKSQLENTDGVTASQNSSCCIIFPNPAVRGLFTVRSMGERRIQKISIYSLSGLSIADFSVNDLTEYCSSIPLAAGTYFIRIIIDNQVETHKLVVL